MKGSWESSLLTWNPSDTSLSPLSSSNHVWLTKNTEPLRGPGVEGNTKRTNFGNKCFRVLIFHINYYFELCLIVFHPHIFHNMNSHSTWVCHFKKSTRQKTLLIPHSQLPCLKVCICLEINSLAITIIKTEQKEPKNQQLHYWKLYRYMHFFQKRTLEFN